jgi:hypothetical protein
MSVPVIPAFSRGQDIVLLKDYKYKWKHYFWQDN